jgi:hypothetical protein
VPAYPFADVVTSEGQLREIVGTPGDRAVRKQLAALDEHSRRFIEHSPFALSARRTPTAGATSRRAATVPVSSTSSTTRPS